MNNQEEKFEILSPMPPASQTIAPVSEAAGVMALITNLASKPSFDIAKLEKLMELHKRQQDQEALRAYNTDFVKMKPHLPRVIRTKENTQTSSKYAPLEDINEVIDPILEKFGFGSSFTILGQTKDDITGEIQIRHSGGHIEKTTLTMPLDRAGPQGKVNKTDIQAIASTITYLKRVGLGLALNISTGDDNDGNRPKQESEFVTHEQAVEIDVLVRETNANREKFLEFMKTDDVRNISASDYRKAMNMLNEKKKRATENPPINAATTPGESKVVE